MKCVVCGREHNETDRCPTCKFPIIVVPGEGSWEDMLRENKAFIDSFRQRFLEGIKVSVETCHWKNKNGKLALDHKDSILLGNGQSMYSDDDKKDNTAWCDQKFARIPDVDTVAVHMVFEGSTVPRKEVEIKVPNLKESDFQKIGASFSGQCEMTLSLKNSSKTTKSDKIAVFRD